MGAGGCAGNGFAQDRVSPCFMQIRADDVIGVPREIEETGRRCTGHSPMPDGFPPRNILRGRFRGFEPQEIRAPLKSRVETNPPRRNGSALKIYGRSKTSRL